jgi:hypothetical protein
MKRVALVGFLGLIFFAGCRKGGEGESVPETPPPTTSPAVTASQVFRPVFKMARGPASAGTGFFLTAPSCKVIALTASHVLDKPEWNAVTGVSFESMDGRVVNQIDRKPDYLGRSFDELPPLENSRFPVFDTSEDFALWRLAADAKTPSVLELAANDPKVNEWVWVAGAEGGKSYALYLAKVTKVKGGTLMMQQHAKFAPRGFSGGPVLSADGKVVGNLLAADPGSGQMAGAAASNIRKRISGY